MAVPRKAKQKDFELYICTLHEVLAILQYNTPIGIALEVKQGNSYLASARIIAIHVKD